MNNWDSTQRNISIAADIESGMSCADVCEKYNLTKTHVYCIARQYGVNDNWRWRRSRKISEQFANRDAEITRLVGLKWPNRLIADTLGCSVATVKLRCSVLRLGRRQRVGAQRKEMKQAAALLMLSKGANA